MICETVQQVDDHAAAIATSNARKVERDTASAPRKVKRDTDVQAKSATLELERPARDTSKLHQTHVDDQSQLTKAQLSGILRTLDSYASLTRSRGDLLIACIEMLDDRV